VIPSHILQELSINSFLALGLSSPNPPVACVITDEKNNILSSAHTQKTGYNHAEKEAYEKLGSNFDAPHFVYVTLEPCSHYGKTPPCIDIILNKKPKKVFLGSLDPNPIVRKRDSLNLLNQNGIEYEFSEEIKEISEEYLAGFFMRINKNRPLVLIKSAISVEGYYKQSSLKRIQITSNESNIISQCIRQSVDGIVVGSSTVKYDLPKLNFRSIKKINPSITPIKNIYFNSIFHILSNEYLIKIINDRQNQPYRIFVISNKNFPEIQFFIDQKSIGINKTIFIQSENLIKENESLLFKYTSNEIYKSSFENIKNVIIEIANKFEMNSILVEGGNSLYKQFVLDLNKEDKIIEIQSNITINFGEKPFWMDKKEIQTKNSFQISNDNWKIKGK
jgi:diaminohydroxyphosphoribosylaminopyrimidine deaminase / 5-amino-6-(5-phosphoribosylamino)uracil reductase